MKTQVFENMINKQAQLIEQLQADKAALEADVTMLTNKKDEHTAALVQLSARVDALERSG